MKPPEQESSRAAGRSPAGRPSPETVDADLRGFGPLGVLAMIVILVTGNVRVAPMVFVPVGAILVLVVSNVPLHEAVVAPWQWQPGWT